MTNEEIKFEKRPIPPTQIESKNIQNPYAEKYMEDKKRIVVQENIRKVLNSIKTRRSFSSDNETLKFLCKLESDCSKKHMIKEISKCPDCPTTMSAEHIGKLHNHVDGNAHCFGCLQRDYQIAMTEEDHEAIVEMLAKRKTKSDITNDSNDENSEQTDTTTKTQREIDEELWKSRNIGESTLKALRISKGYEKREEEKEKASE